MQLRKEMAAEEARFQASLLTHAQKVLSGKSVLSKRKLLGESGHPDPEFKSLRRCIRGHTIQVSTLLVEGDPCNHLSGGSVGFFSLEIFCGGVWELLLIPESVAVRHEI